MLMSIDFRCNKQERVLKNWDLMGLKMKILLIQPKMNKRPMDTDLKLRMSPSLALLTLMNLTPDKHETIMINENVEKINYDCGADLIGITITLDVMPRACQIAPSFRNAASRLLPVVFMLLVVPMIAYRISMQFALVPQKEFGQR